MLLKAKVIIPIALLTGTLVTYGVYQFLQNKDEIVQEPVVESERIVVAADNLFVGHRIQLEDIKVVEWPENLLPENSFSDAGLVVGRVLRSDIGAGETILEYKLASKGSDGGFSSIIPAGMRALTVSVDTYSGVSGFILPNTRVDVLVTVSSMMKKEASTTKIFLEDIKVLAVDQQFERKDDDPKSVQAVTLLVTPPQAEKLALASTEGKLTLSLRNDTDHGEKNAKGVRLSELIYRPRPKRTIRGPSIRKPTRVVEILRSNERSEVVF